MRRKKIIEAAVVCILLLLLGAYMEFSDRSMDDKNQNYPGQSGQWAAGSGTYAECRGETEKL